MMMRIPRRYQMMAIPVVLLTLIFMIAQYRYQLQNLLSYSTRPLWDKDYAASDVVTHYYASGLEVNSPATCQLHGWKERDVGRVIVIDAVLMSSELDLLEIRMNELDSVVDYFFIVESNYTFTGLPKPTYFEDNRSLYSKFANKIVYGFLPGAPLRAGESAWDVEARTRDTMSNLIRGRIPTFPANAETLVVMSDVDEIPSSHSIALLKACDFGTEIHLQLRNYLYSYEWLLGLTSWRASVHLWQPATYYRHGKSTDRILSDAGWHCSYCFRTIPEYIAKMKGFSHSDRIGGNMRLLDPRRIQETICNGKDIFGMLPEAYSYLDMFSQMSLKPQKTAVDLPRYLIEQADKFKFLLPGGCKRAE